MGRGKRVYTGFAGIYDLLMQDVDYAAWARYYASLMQETGVKKGARCVECACGTGSLTLPLQKMGYKMTGLDLSGEMLEIAMEKCRSAGEMIPFIRQDMRKMLLPRKVDCVLCTCDGVNYLWTEDDLNAFLQSAHQALKSGGALVFDLSTPYKLKEVLGNSMWNRTDEDYAYLWNNEWDEKRQTVSMLLTLFTRAPGEETFVRSQEQQIQRAWDETTLTHALEKNGFQNVRIKGEMRNDTVLKPQDQRWHVLAEKI